MNTDFDFEASQSANDDLDDIWQWEPRSINEVCLDRAQRAHTQLRENYIAEWYSDESELDQKLYRSYVAHLDTVLENALSNLPTSHEEVDQWVDNFFKISRLHSYNNDSDTISSSGTLFPKEVEKSCELERVGTLSWTKRNSAVTVSRDSAAGNPFLDHSVIRAMRVWLSRKRAGLSHWDREDVVSEALVYYAELLTKHAEDGTEGWTDIQYAIAAIHDVDDAHKYRMRQKRKEVDFDYEGDEYMFDQAEQVIDVVEAAEVETWKASLTLTQAKAFKDFMEWNEYAGDGVVTPKKIKQRLNRVPKAECETFTYCRTPKKAKPCDDLRTKIDQEFPVTTTRKRVANDYIKLH